MKATEKQLRYIEYLRARTKWSGKWMSAAWKQLGAGMRQRSGTVADYLAGLTMSEASALISTLKTATNK